MESRKEKALALHDRGYNCAQSVACAYADLTDLEEKDLFAVCEALGLGMGGMKATCGALTGACVLAGAVNSSVNLEAPDSKKDTYRLSRALVEKFLERNTTLVCRELKGADTGRVIRPCADCITDACEFVEEVLFADR